ncbi:MAG: hypothetical protein KC502_10565 [Myxococcales bacterium]|nr:hypothetical protein [Myxococcales bacterium]
MGAPVAVSLAPPTVGPIGVGVHRKTASGARGRFEIEVPTDRAPLREQRIRLRAQAADSPSHGSAVYDGVVHVGRPVADVEVEVHPTRVLTDLKEIRVSAFVGLAGVPSHNHVVNVAVDNRNLARATTGEDGWAEVSIAVKRLLPAGVHQLRVSTPATAHVNGRTVAKTIEVHVAVDVALHRITTGCEANSVCIEGSVRAHSDGATELPVKGAAVILHGERHQLGILRTNADGRFAARLRMDVLSDLFAPGAIGVVAEVRVPKPFHEVGWSPVVAVDIPPPSSPSEWLYLGFLSLIAMALVGRRWFDRRRERALADELAATAAGLPVLQVRHTGSGTDSTVLRGVVIHGESGQPSPATLILDGPQPQTVPAPTGNFDISGLAVGRWTLRIMTTEHEPLDVVMTIPHDGTFDGCELLPRSCRAIVRGQFSATVNKHTGRAVDWRDETPARVEDRWMRARRRGHAAIRLAVEVTDAALYGRQTELSDAQRVSDALEETER